ncbi:MAG TPA: potassium uptake protein TrkA [Planctomycetaceae bacterium]|nr:potassium uptake protein TrkA [Planctomycetaceae bacterium]
MSAVSFAILAIAAVAVAGLMFGGIKVRGVSLGTAGVLLAGLIAGDLIGRAGGSVDSDMLSFAKEFGLLLFVFTTGIELGPGILRLLARRGASLNLMATGIVVLGLGSAMLAAWLLGLTPPAAAGLFCGATTNTPALAAAEQALSWRRSSESRENGVTGDAPAPTNDLRGGDSQDAAAVPSESHDRITDLTATYAVTYPGGVAGIILAMLLLRRLFRIDVATEARLLREQEAAEHEALERRCLLIDNRHLNGLPFGRLAGVEETGIRISRILRSDSNDVVAANDRTVLHPGDVIQVVGTRESLDRIEPSIGPKSDIDLTQRTGNVRVSRVFVTRSEILNRSLAELALDQLFGTTVTRIERAGIEMPARGATQLHFGDVVHVVGDPAAVEQTAALLGNSARSLQQTPFVPMFIGITAGILLGTIGIPVPGLATPVRFGLAGGPLLAGIAFGLVGSIGRLVWYIPSSANHALRQLGMILFLAAAGLGAGRTFLALAFSLEGAGWIVAGLLTTLLPLLIVGIVARVWAGQNYCILCGAMAGSMTDPPALSFAQSLTESESCSKAYAAVYPLTMLLRIVAAQLLVLLG